MEQEALERFKEQVVNKIPKFQESFGTTSPETARQCLRWLRMQKFKEEQAFKVVLPPVCRTACVKTDAPE